MEETVYFSGNQLPQALCAIAPAILCTVPLSISDSEMNSNTIHYKNKYVSCLFHE